MTTTSTPVRCLSVVIPCFNEEPTIAELLERVLAQPWTNEVLVVDDGSTDGSARAIESVGDKRIRLLRQPRNLGKGAALRRGLSHATSPYVVVQDADLEYDPAEYGTLLQPLLDGKADVVYGSRFSSIGAHRVLYFWHSIGNRLLTLLSNMATNLSLTDMETCYKAFRREVLADLLIEEDRFGFEPEITAKVARGGWRVYEVGISYAGRTYEEGKKIGWRDGFRALWCIGRYNIPRRAPTMPPRSPADFESADAELAGVLDSLGANAPNYTDWIADLCAPYLGQRVLEVGAGHGDLTVRFARPGVELAATDVSERCLDVLKERFEDVEQVEVGRLDLFDHDDPGGYDSAVLVNVLEHLPDDLAALQELRRLVRPGGHILLYVPAFERLYSPFDRAVGHYRRYDRAQLSRTVHAAGLQVIEARYVNQLGALAWWLLATKLKQVPTEAGKVRLYDRAVVPRLRRFEERYRTEFGQSLFLAAVVP